MAAIHQSIGMDNRRIATWNSTSYLSQVLYRRRYSDTSSATHVNAVAIHTSRSAICDTVTQKRQLFAFDFDHTLIDENSDLYIKRLAPNGKLPAAIEASYNDNGWIDYMNSIFVYLSTVCSVSKDQMKACISEIPLTHGMLELLTCLGASPNNDVIIISDSNQTFIDWVLQREGLLEVVSAVYTNPSTYDASEHLKVEYYHTQDWCALSTVNLCKGHILQAHIEAKRTAGCEYSFVAYIGDGTNDFCPAKTLPESGMVFARKNHSLEKAIAKNPQAIKARVCEWLTGHDIMRKLNDLNVLP